MASFVLVELLVLAGLLCEAHGVPKGHGKPFGEHRPPEGEIQSVDGNTVTPAEFWEYHRRHEAVVLRNVTTSWPAVHRWTTERLKDPNGWGKFLMRTEGKVEGTAIPLTMPLSTFLEKADAKRYVVGELPTPMYDDVDVPQCFSCGPFSSHITEVDVWISNGGTRSKFHKDSNNQLNCLIKGTKQWTVIDPTYIRQVPMMWEDEDPAIKTAGESLIDPEALDLMRFPDILQVPYNRSLLQPGDCIWMPGSTLHNVYSQADSTGRNMQVSFLMSEVPSVNKGISPYYQSPPPFDPNAETPCSKGWAKRKLSDVYVAWPYPGSGGTTYGFDCPKKFKSRMGLIMKDMSGGTGVMNQQEFVNLYSAMLHNDFPRKPTEKLFVYEAHQKYIPDAINIIKRRDNYNLGSNEEWEKKSILKNGRRYYPGLREASIKLALRALKDWWEQSPLTKDGKITQEELDSLGTREFQESWAFLYFPVQSIGHAFMGAMENDGVRNEDYDQADDDERSEVRHCSHHEECGDPNRFFCTKARNCEPHGECHFHHDAVDGRCPEGAVQGRSQEEKTDL